ncbi:adenosine kinase [Chryseobacterium lactis]|uniref:Adenosine kinase n=1 Tax=Chryseobacterium lactis TaxID=1241981 RepID=A0A3G6RNK9_CHRLC|nr:adenosine kinase [Chryseobacterium lactis]AZA84411.1 adenosine kinase [Chryseobacterium lactis]AZB04799.1 adenosine kinase [Chryseobacterium lactis]PNW14530.1 adenosine kinase [Chryseobacterium lactis]
MMKKYFTYILLFGSPLFLCQNKTDGKSTYQQSWVTLEEENAALAFDADIQLTNPELALDKKLFEVRKQFLSETEKQKIPIYNSSFNQIKPLIESSSLFKIFQTMPKGGLLHTHSGGLASMKWVISTARKYKECYVFDQKDTKDFIYGQLAFFENGKAPQGFVSLDKKLVANPDFENELLGLLTLKRDNLCSYNDYWIEFEKRFTRINLLLPYRPFFKEYYKEGFRELLKDKIQHVEIRYVFDELYDFQHGKYPLKTSITDLQDIVKEIRKSDPQFSLKLIYSSFKFLDSESIGKQLEIAFGLKKEFPDMISGFDLVADEAAGHSINSFQKNWSKLNELSVKYGVQMPLFLHAGESASVFNKNILDVSLLNNQRIGHGFNLIYFPKTMELIKKQNRLVEVSPISNQILGYVSDLRNHPARVLLSNGVQCSINSDDPSVYGYDGLSYDFWTAFVFWELDVKALKKLVFNSINYSSLNDNEKKQSLAYLNKEWDSFIQKTNMDLK